MVESGSYDSSGGAFPNGYCIWQLWIGDAPSIFDCHCKDGYDHGTGPIDVDAEYDGQMIKWPCELIE